MKIVSQHSTSTDSATPPANDSIPVCMWLLARRANSCTRRSPCSYCIRRAARFQPRICVYAAIRTHNYSLSHFLSFGSLHGHRFQSHVLPSICKPHIQRIWNAHLEGAQQTTRSAYSCCQTHRYIPPCDIFIGVEPSPTTISHAGSKSGNPYNQSTTKELRYTKASQSKDATEEAAAEAEPVRGGR